MHSLQQVFVFVFVLVLFHRCNPDREQSTEPFQKVSIAEIEEGIRTYILKKEQENGGYFEVSDRGRNYRMKLVRVHTEYLSNLGRNHHFACVDLAEEGGDVYDVDFFLTGKPGEMSVTETSVHKLNGKPFYAWKQRKDKTWHRVPVKEASTRLLGVVEGTDAFEFYYQVQLPEMTSNGRLWLPIATTDAHQKVEVLSLKAPGEYQLLKDPDYGNTIFFMELTPQHGGQVVEITYQVERLEKGPSAESDPPDKKYLADNRLLPVGGRFAEIAKTAVQGRDATSLMQARALYDYIIDNMRYMKFGTYGTGDANYACDARTGNCTEFHSFFISLARSVGIPARFAVGASIPSERNEGGIDGYHCWAEFYAEGKWWPVDISEANKYTALATYYFGHHPANRIELSRGRDLQVEPGPASGPINFLAYPILEVDGKEVAARTSFSFLRPGKPAS